MNQTNILIFQGQHYETGIQSAYLKQTKSSERETEYVRRLSDFSFHPVSYLLWDTAPLGNNAKDV